MRQYDRQLLLRHRNQSTPWSALFTLTIHHRDGCTPVPIICICVSDTTTLHSTPPHHTTATTLPLSRDKPISHLEVHLMAAARVVCCPISYFLLGLLCSETRIFATVDQHPIATIHLRPISRLFCHWSNRIYDLLDGYSISCCKIEVPYKYINTKKSNNNRFVHTFIMGGNSHGCSCAIFHYHIVCNIYRYPFFRDGMYHIDSQRVSFWWTDGYF